MNFLSSKKVSYKCKDTPIIIEDGTGKIIYYKKNKDKKKIIFNINTERHCFTDNKISVVKKKANNKFLTIENLLRKYPRQNFYRPEILKIVKGSNRNKASIFPSFHLIKLDENLYKKIPYFAKTFILFHEAGHLYYKDETLCDLFAICGMIERGYNFSDSFYTQIHILKKSKKQIERLNFTIKNLRNGK